MRHNLIDRLKEEWAQLDPVDPLRGLISDAIDALQRKPLTDEQIMEMYNEPRSDAEMLEFARAIEAAHGIGEQK